MHTCPRCKSDDVNVTHGPNNAIMLAAQIRDKDGTPIDWEKVNSLKVQARCLDCGNVTTKSA